jgi:hypothetical protein
VGLDGYNLGSLRDLKSSTSVKTSNRRIHI